MKVVSTDALTKLIQLVKSAFIKVGDVIETQEVTLADVATTGDFDDLINKPTIPDTSNLANKDLSNLSSTGNAKFQAPLVSGNGINIDTDDNSIDLIQQDVAATEEYTWSDLTINSNLVNADNVISNFYNNRYITMPNEALTVTSSDEMVFQVRFKKTSFSSTMDYLYAAAVGSSNADSGLVIYFTSNNLYVRIGNSSTNKLSYSGLSLNIFYTLNIQYKNGILSGTITDENGTTQALTVVSGSAISSLIVSNIGRFGHMVRTGSGQYLRGAIDLNQTFIKVNDTLFHATVTGSPAQIVAKATNNLYGLVKPDGTTITVNNGVISSSGSRNVGEIIQSSLPLTDAGLHLLDGSLLRYGIYKEFIDYIAELYGDGTNIPSYFCTENEWQTSVTTYGICGKFVYDSTNNTVRLPKVTGIIEGTTDVTALGDLVEAGLPNITGGCFIEAVHSGFSGALYDNGSSSTYMGNQQYTADGGIGFDASRSSSIYGNSTTVQPQTIKCFVYIVIANSTKTEIQVDIDEIATDLNGKADTDLANVSDTGTSTGAGWAMPSDTYIDLTLGASESTYTAPANGWFQAACSGTAGSAFFELATNQVSATASFTGGWARASIPILKGQQMTVYYGGGNFKKELFRFTYAQGSESEAS